MIVQQGLQDPSPTTNTSSQSDSQMNRKNAQEQKGEPAPTNDKSYLYDSKGSEKMSLHIVQEDPEHREPHEGGEEKDNNDDSKISLAKKHFQNGYEARIMADYRDSVSSDIASDSSKSLTSSKQRLDFSPPNSMHRNLSDGPPFTGMPRSSGGSLTSSRVLFGKKHSSESTPADMMSSPLLYKYDERASPDRYRQLYQGSGTSSVFDYWKEVPILEEHTSMRDSIFMRINNIDDVGYEESTASSCDDSSEEPELSILTWSAFQRELKDKFNIIKIEQSSKETFSEEIKKLTVEYLNNHLKFREFDESLKNKLKEQDQNPPIHSSHTVNFSATGSVNTSTANGRESITNLGKDKDNNSHPHDENQKTLVSDPYEVLGEQSFLAKKLLDKIFENPKILAYAFQGKSDKVTTGALEYSLCNHFYQNLMEHGKYEHDLLRAIAELLKLEISEAKTPADILRGDSFCHRMINAYFSRPECKKYSKVILKNPVLKVIRDSVNLIVDIQAIAKQLAKRTENLQKTQDPKLSSSAILHSKSFIEGPNSNAKDPKQPAYQPRMTIQGPSAAASLLNSANGSNSSQSFIETESVKSNSSTSSLRYAKMLESYYQEHQKNQNGKDGRSTKTVPYSDLLRYMEKKIVDSQRELPQFVKIDRSRKKGRMTMMNRATVSRQTKDLKKEPEKKYSQ